MHSSIQKTTLTFLWWRKNLSYFSLWTFFSIITKVYQKVSSTFLIKITHFFVLFLGSRLKARMRFWTSYLSFRTIKRIQNTQSTSIVWFCSFWHPLNWWSLILNCIDWRNFSLFKRIWFVIWSKRSISKEWKIPISLTFWSTIHKTEHSSNLFSIFILHWWWKWQIHLLFKQRRLEETKRKKRKKRQSSIYSQCTKKFLQSTQYSLKRNSILDSSMSFT